MLVPLVKLLCASLDPHDLGNLRLVSKTLNKSISKSEMDKSVKAALAKYKQMVVLPDNTVRIHSSLGKTKIELVLPDFELRDLYEKVLSMRLDGQLYRGRADVRRVKTNLSPHMFHAKSAALFQAESVNVVSINSFLGFDGYTTKVCVLVGDSKFTLNFQRV